MNKSILIVDTPENCFDCPCHFKNMVTINPKKGEKFIETLCGINNKELEPKDIHKGKPNWCPLKVLPQKANHPDYCDDGRYDNSWNDCIDKFLKEYNEIE